MIIARERIDLKLGGQGDRVDKTGVLGVKSIQKWQEEAKDDG
jgi:hypothetical protein